MGSNTRRFSGERQRCGARSNTWSASTQGAAGRTIGVLTDRIAESTVDNVVLPFLEPLDATLATVGVLQDSEADRTAVAAEIEAFSENWRVSGVDLLLVVGNNGLPQVPAVRALLGNIDIATMSGSTMQQIAGNASDDERVLFDGVLSIAGLSPLDGEQFAEPLLQDCVATVEPAGGHEFADIRDVPLESYDAALLCVPDGPT